MILSMVFAVSDRENRRSDLLANIIISLLIIVGTVAVVIAMILCIL